ncbi:MAG: hypothetical protein K0S23_2773 [Fluviicola sp.]|jgi:hypothetical protein|uniref:hypothetical protein n=1 Tax=Fluviicola sp. TaxID=1917219 RepID=UPI0026150945|nr:hypothetical protein [Fluviicola sp.]MDF3028466.1 hypothetical protein [Fluviicola sp.]
MGIWRYFVLSSYIIPIGIGGALLKQKRLSFSGLLLWSFLLFTLSIEIGGTILAFKGVNNLWLYRIYLYSELVFPVIFFFNRFSKRKSKVSLLIVSISAIILTTLTNIFDNWQSYASIQTVITFACIAFIIISYFVEMFQLEKVFNPFKDVYFVVGGVLLLGYSSTLLYNVLYDYVIMGYFGLELNHILDGVNMGLIVFYNVLYSYALWISRPHQA